MTDYAVHANAYASSLGIAAHPVVQADLHTCDQYAFKPLALARYAVAGNQFVNAALLFVLFQLHDGMVCLCRRSAYARM